MSTCAGRPPELSPENVSIIVKEHFSFHSIVRESVRSFPSYEDRNYYFVGVQADQLKGINQLMNYLNSLGLSKSYPLPTASGEYLASLCRNQMVEERPNDIESSSSCAEKETQALKEKVSPGDLVYFVRVLIFVPGDLLHLVDRSYFVPSLLHSIGQMLGKVDKALMV